MAFAQNLREARDRQHMSQSDLARATGLTRAVISKWEKGESSNPSAPALQLAAKVLQVSVENLLKDRPQNAKTAYRVIPDRKARGVAAGRGDQAQGITDKEHERSVLSAISALVPNLKKRDRYTFLDLIGEMTSMVEQGEIPLSEIRRRLETAIKPSGSRVKG